MNPPRTGRTDSAPHEYSAPSLAQGATHPATFAPGRTSEPAYLTPVSPGHAYAEVQYPVVKSGAVKSPVHRRLTWLPVTTEFGQTQGPASELGPPAATVELPERRGAPSSTSLQPASQSSDRDEEIRQAWIDLKRYCLCKDRTKKALRHWEDQCPYNLNKSPLRRCSLPGCRNKTGFRSSYNLRRHQEKASYHKAQK
ncbi:hypothetical protein FS837_001945 [Tulasnella sp. UAMH 9824]|nr:hypothetical protein FS837_001945 [Tulasnella sp. UAMH 9824]